MPLSIIRRWKTRLTGTPEVAEDRNLEECVTVIQKWHATKVVAEQMVVLETSELMLRQEVSARDLSRYLGSSEVKTSPLGRFCLVTGLAEWPGKVVRYFLPLLKSGEYRPFLRDDVIAAMQSIQRVPSLPRDLFEIGNLADMLFATASTPYFSKRFLRAVRESAAVKVSAAEGLLESLAEARRAAAREVANLDAVEEIVSALVPSEEPVES